jgi:hypothetical protein
MLVGAAAAAAHAAGAGEAPGPGQSGGSETAPEPPPVAAAPDSEGSWAGATRQAGATIERLRSPLGVAVLVLVLLGVILGRCRRGRGVEDRGPPPGAAG